MDREAYIFASLLALANRIQILGDKLDNNMTMKQWMLVAAISKSEQQSLSISELAHIVGTSHQNIKKMALILEKQGFLSFGKSAADKRVTNLTLTDYCKEYFQSRSEMEHSFMKAVFQGFDATGIDELYRGMLHLQTNIEHMELKDQLQKGD